MSIVAIDFETNSLEWYYPTFRITHLSVAYCSGRCIVLDNEVEIINALRAIAYDTTIDKVLVYNLGFDGSVVRYWYTELFALLEPKMIDVMRLRQHMEPDEAESWGLKAAAKKFLKVDAWEAEVQQQVAERGGVASKFREHLHLCDPLVVAKYNAMDSVYTLKLFNHFCSFFSNQGYDWKKDHEEYKRLVWRVTGAQKRGIRVDAENLAIYSSKIEAELNEHITGFKELHKDAIDRLQLKWTEEERNKRKTEKGKAGVKPVVFNVGSNKQLAALFCGELGIEPRFRTPTGEPSFKSAHLFSYGDMAEALTTLGKRELVKNFCDKTVELSSVDGLLHHTMKIVGTVSGRLSGGGGLNMLAAPRRDAGYMSCLQAPEGQVFVSQDLSSGEPTILAEFSKDKTYSYLTVGSRGKAPFWENKQLMLDDLYLSLLSTFPMGKAVMQDAWGKEWPAGTFVDQWLADPEVIKASVKKLRQLAKICCLGLGYGMGAAKLKQTLFDNGFDVTDNECSAIHRAYWKAFPGVKEFATKQATRVTENQGFLVNPFGYAMHCSPHKALNYTIQSSLNYVINYYIERFLEELPSAEFVVTIHDELIVTIPQDAVEEAKEAQKRAISALNNHLHTQHGWSLNVSLGFAVGANLYEAK